MSSLMVSNDLDIMMLEFSVEKLFVPKTSIFDDVIMKETTVMFRMLDQDWTSVKPHRTDYAPYHGSNLEEEEFHGGKSIVFAMPSASFERSMRGVDIQIHARKNISTYFEMDSCQNVGTALVNVDSLFNSIIKELREREDLNEYLSCAHKREPISRSLKGSYEFLDEDERPTGATILLYVRLSYCGKSVITEIETVPGRHRVFYAQEETNEKYPYQCKELRQSDLEGGCWGSRTFLSPIRPDQLSCHCDTCVGIDEQTYDKSEDSDDEKGDHVDKATRYSGSRRSTGDKDRRRSSGDKGKHRKGKPNGKSGKKYRAMNGKLANEEGGAGNAKKRPLKRVGKGEKDVKGGDVIKGGDGTRENDSPGRPVHPDRMEIFKVESENKRDVDRRGGVEEFGRKTGKTRKRLRLGDDGGMQSQDRSTGRKSTDDDGETTGRAKGHGGSGRKDGTTRGARVEKKTAKKRTDGINVAPVKVEKPQAVEDRKRKGDSEDQKPLGAPKAQTGMTSAMSADGVGPPGGSPIDAKQTLVDTGGSMSTSESIKRREQLRKRRRGVVTVGFDDKEKRICQEALGAPLRTPASPSVESATMPIQFCSNLHYPRPYCYAGSATGNTLLYWPHSCFMNTKREHPDRLLTKLPVTNMAELEILTN